jgi:hypothetical protein
MITQERIYSLAKKGLLVQISTEKKILSENPNNKTAKFRLEKYYNELRELDSLIYDLIESR